MIQQKYFEITTQCPSYTALFSLHPLAPQFFPCPSRHLTSLCASPSLCLSNTTEGGHFKMVSNFVTSMLLGCHWQNLI